MGVIFALFKNDKILLQQRDKNCSRFPLHWCFPGGGTEGEETPIQTLTREVFEEYKIILDKDQCKFVTLFYNNDDKSVPNSVYLCELNQDQNPEMNEGQAMKWYSLDEIENIELGFNQKSLVSIFKNFLNSIRP